MARKPLFATIRTEGGLLPSDLLARVASDDRDLPGLTPEDYHLPKGERIGEAITRSWNRLVGARASFRASLEETKPDDAATGLTRERFLLPLFAELGFGRLAPSKGITVEDVSFPVSHGWGAVPIHLVGARVDLDRRTAGVAGAARSSPHSLVQDLLNRSDEYLWGIVANGERLRLLRDNSSMTRQAFVEFDLASMFDGEVYADFVVLWLTCNQSRFEAERPEACLLEQWTEAAVQQGTRVLEQLRDGVERAIQHLGQGFLSHTSNSTLRDSLRSGQLSTQNYYRQLLRIVYRLLFLFAAEDRSLLVAPEADAVSRHRYMRYYSTTRLRSLARTRRGSMHPDLWQVLRVVMDALGNEGRPELGLPVLGSFLWSADAVRDVARCELSNKDLLAAVAALAFTKDRREKVARDIDYRNLGAEELGSVYESLLELHPEVNLDAATFTLSSAAGHERKVTGSYYTPTSLITVLLDSSLDPLLDEAIKADKPEAALLGLKVCDPACGSGHFLIAAAHRIARRVAMVRTDDPEPGPDAMRTALRDVIGHCIYGIDVNPMAVELCKVSLWLEALEPGMPLSFLEHRIACGNSLLGTTPRLLEEGIPDEAFKALTGDDKTVVAELKKRNKAERGGQATLDLHATTADLVEPLVKEIRTIDEIIDRDVDAVREKDERWRRLLSGPEFARAKLVADAWCAAFVIPKRKGDTAVTQDFVERLQGGTDRIPDDVREAINEAAERYRFLHWHLAFPDVFRLDGDGQANRDTGWFGGFDLVCGNPPWERVKLSEREFFATLAPDIAEAKSKAIRGRMIDELRKDDLALWRAFQDALYQAEAESHFLRTSGRYPLCGRGDVNTYAVFAEVMRHAVGRDGRVGCILPSGIATDTTTSEFFANLIDCSSLVALLGFYDRKQIFASADVHSFCILTICGSATKVRDPELIFDARSVEELADPERRFTLTPEDFALINPNTRNCPAFRSRRDAEITKGIYRRFGVLINRTRDESGNPWGITLMRMFDMSTDSRQFRDREELIAGGYSLEGNVFLRGDERMLPLYEGRLGHQFNHRFASQPSGVLIETPEAQLLDPTFAIEPQYWVSSREAETRAARRQPECRTALLGFRRVARSTDERTVIASLIPWGAASYGWILTMGPTPERLALLAGIYNSFVFDYVARSAFTQASIPQSIFEQLAAPGPEAFARACPWDHTLSLADWTRNRVLELVYTSRDLVAYARDLGYDGEPFCWNLERRALLRAELDSALFHLYGVNRDEVDYIMETFPVIRRRDEAAHGEYRTKRMILENYDDLASSLVRDSIRASESR